MPTIKCLYTFCFVLTDDNAEYKQLSVLAESESAYKLFVYNILFRFSLSANVMFAVHVVFVRFFSF